MVALQYEKFADLGLFMFSYIAQGAVCRLLWVLCYHWVLAYLYENSQYLKFKLIAIYGLPQDVYMDSEALIECNFEGVPLKISDVLIKSQHLVFMLEFTYLYERKLFHSFHFSLCWFTFFVASLLISNFVFIMTMKVLLLYI